MTHINDGIPVKIDQFLIGDTLTIYETYSNEYGNLMMMYKAAKLEKTKFGMISQSINAGFYQDDFGNNRFTIIRTFIGNPSKVEFFSIN